MVESYLLVLFCLPCISIRFAYTSLFMIDFYIKMGKNLEICLEKDINSNNCKQSLSHSYRLHAFET